MIEEYGHRYSIHSVQDYIDEALIDIKQLDENLYDRYENPFEDKFTLRDKNNLPVNLSWLVSSLESEEMLKDISELFGVELLLDSDRHYCGVFKYADDGRLSVHVDAGIHPSNGKRKHVTAVLYLGEGKGSLELWRGKNCVEAEPIIFDCFKRIEPKHGRLVLFENNDFAWHGIGQCNGDPRFVVTVSYLSDEVEAFRNKRQRAFFVPRPNEHWSEADYALRNQRADSKVYAGAYRV